jgi:hypothetical protein
VAREIESVQSIVLTPVGAVPTQPFSPRGDVAKIDRVTLGKTERKVFI